MRKLAGFVTGAALVLVAALLMAPSGGFPSRPRFQSVGIAEIAPTGTGGLAAQRIGVGIGGAPAGAGELEVDGTIYARGNRAIVAESTTNPELELNMQDIITDEGRWQIQTRTSPSGLVFKTLNDAGNQQREFLRVERAAEAVLSLAFGNTTNNPTYNFLGTGTAIHSGRLRLAAFTVATLPAGVQGDVAYVTDASAPTYLATVVGGGAVRAPVFYNGTNWVAH